METGEKTNDTGEYRYHPDQVDWKTMSNIGLTRERLEKLGHLETLLKGFKTNDLVPLEINLGKVIVRLDARLSLQPGPDDTVVAAVHGIRKWPPNLNFPAYGHVFTPEDKENLLRTGNMGRIVELTNKKTGEKFDAVMSLDRMTHEVIAYRADKIKIPDEIKNVTINDEQRQTLLEGKAAFIEGMTAKNGEKFDAYVQFNADKRFVEFLFGDRVPIKQQQQSVAQHEAPKVVRGKMLDDVQYEKFSRGETIYETGLVKKEGGLYEGYLTFNKTTGKTDFSFGNPDSVKEKLVPSSIGKKKAPAASGKKKIESAEPPKSGLKTPAKSKARKV